MFNCEGISTSLEIEFDSENENCPEASLSFDIPFDIFIIALLLSKCKEDTTPSEKQ